MPAVASVRFQAVDKSFGACRALRQVSMVLPQGWVAAVVGESGSGKSTLLQLINAVHRADSGLVEVFGVPVPTEGVPAFRRRIGYAVQGAGLFPHLTVRQNVLIPARLAAWPVARAECRLRDMLDMMAVDEDLLARYPHQLSGGQQQRIGLCRSMLLEPELLLLDEPFSALDPVTRTDIHEQFLQLQASQQLSTVLVTHDMREAIHLARFLVILKDGEVLRAADVDEVLSDPGHEYVARLLSEANT